MATYKCPFCKRKYIEKDGVYLHMEKEHNQEMHGLSAKQIYFNYTNRYALTKGYGKSVISGKPTKFNEITGRYERFLPEEKEAYRKYFLANMKRAGKEHLMKDMEHQKMMLSHRKISGKYKFKDNVEITYTGTYEKKFLEYLDTYLEWPSSDICGPAPQLFPYVAPDGTEHVHIPDFYISSLNLIVNIKSADNKHYRLRDIDIEKLEDEAIKRSNFNYVKIYDNEFDKFTDAIEVIKKNTENNIEKRIIIESEDLSGSSEYSIIMEGIEMNNEEFLDEDTLYGWFELESENLDEMAYVGDIPNTQYQIHIEGKEGNIPHMHICINNGKKENVVLKIELTTNRYFREKDDKMKILNTKERKALDKYLSEELDGLNNWEYLVHTWNRHNPDRKINLKTTNKPDYTEILEG